MSTRILFVAVAVTARIGTAGKLFFSTPSFATQQSGQCQRPTQLYRKMPTLRGLNVPTMPTAYPFESGSEIMPPGADTMCFVNCKVRNTMPLIQRLQNALEGRFAKSFWGNKKHLQSNCSFGSTADNRFLFPIPICACVRSRSQTIKDQVLLGFGQCGRQTCRVHAFGTKSLYLVGHECNQRRYDNGDTACHDSW